MSSRRTVVLPAKLGKQYKFIKVVNDESSVRYPFSRSLTQNQKIIRPAKEQILKRRT